MKIIKKLLLGLLLLPLLVVPSLSTVVKPVIRSAVYDTVFDVTSYGGGDSSPIELYISSSAAPGGDGSITTPYDSFSDINWTTGGDNSIFDFVAAGERVYINLKAGDIFQENLTTGAGGSSANPITIQSYGVGDDPIIDGNSRTIETGVIINHDYFLIKNLKVQEFNTDCIQTNSLGQNILWKDCTFSGSNDQTVQNTACTVVYRNCIIDGGVDEGVSLHYNANVSLYDCTIKDTLGDGGEPLQGSGTGITLYIDGCDIPNLNDRINVPGTAVFNMWRTKMSGTNKNFVLCGNANINYCLFELTATTASFGRVDPLVGTTVNINNCVFYSNSADMGQGTFLSVAATVNYNNTIFYKYHSGARVFAAGSVANFKNTCADSFGYLLIWAGSGTSSESGTVTNGSLVTSDGKIPSGSSCVGQGIAVTGVTTLGTLDLFGNAITASINIGADQTEIAP